MSYLSHFYKKHFKSPSIILALILETILESTFLEINHCSFMLGRRDFKNGKKAHCPRHGVRHRSATLSRDSSSAILHQIHRQFSSPIKFNRLKGEVFKLVGRGPDAAREWGEIFSIDLLLLLS